MKSRPSRDFIGMQTAENSPESWYKKAVPIRCDVDSLIRHRTKTGVRQRFKPKLEILVSSSPTSPVGGTMQHTEGVGKVLDGGSLRAQSLNEFGGNSDRTRLLIATALLFLFALAIFYQAIKFVPGTVDDLEVLSSVAHTTNPLKYLVGDFGMAPYAGSVHGEYRPLHSISIWIVYKTLGIKFGLNQIINFVLHFINSTLVLLLIWRTQKNLALSFMGASLFLVSVHTMSPATWIADRPNLQVGLAFLLLLHHVVTVREAGGKRLRVPYVLFLSIFGLLSKESGLIVPVMAIVASARLAGGTLWQQIRASAVWGTVIVAYFLGRVLMFGSNAISYLTFGILLGVWPYPLASALPGHLRQLAIVDNVLKNVLQMILPVFTEYGGFTFLFDSARVALLVMLGAAAMSYLVASALRSKLTPLQVDCMWAVFFNAVIHNAIFRYRDLYSAQIAISIFIACSPLLREQRRKVIALAAAGVVLAVSIVRVDDFIQDMYLKRYIELNVYKFERLLKTHDGPRLDRQLVQQIVEKYRDRSVEH